MEKYTGFSADSAHPVAESSNETAPYTPMFPVKAQDVHAELGKHILADGYEFVLDLHKSHGATMVDAATGTSFLDFFTCFASIPVGINHPALANPAFVQYIGQAALNKPSNSDLYSEEMAVFVKTFFELAVPSHFRHSFFIEGGGLAVENALKTAFDWKVRKNFQKGITTERGHQIIHFKQAFHGRTGYTMSLTNTDPTKTMYFPKFQWPRVHNPAMRFPLTEENIAHVQQQEQQAIAEIKQAFHDNPDDIAAIILEPIQGEGGDNHFRTEFLQALRQLADENDALLIFDEVQTGVGITGTMWAHEQLGVVPDVMSFGKKMQVCGILAGPRVDEVDDNVFRMSSRINSTWGGNLIDMVRCTKYLEIIHNDNLVDNAKNTGAYLQQQLSHLAAEFPDMVANVRGRGLFTAFDLPTTALRDTFKNHCYNEGLLILGAGTHSMRFRPPLTLTAAQVDEGIDIIKRCLQQTIA